MIYFMRHGESEANARHVFAGQRDDSVLTEKGREQARQAAADIIKKAIEVDRIVASPLLRTQETAAIITADIGLATDRITLDPRLKEYDMGSFTGTPIHAISSAELTAHPETEDPGEFASRVLAALHDFKDSPGTTLIVSHAGVGRIIAAVQQGTDLRNFYDFPEPPNGTIVPLML